MMLRLAPEYWLAPGIFLTTAHSLVEGGRLINPDNVSVYPALNKSDVPFESSNIARIITSPGFHRAMKSRLMILHF